MANTGERRLRGRPMAGRRVVGLFGASVAASALVLSSCGKPPDGTRATPPPAPRQVRVALFKSPAADAAQQLLPEFERQYGIKVVFDSLPYGELLDKVQTEFLGRSARYDVVMADCIWIPKFAAAGYLQSIDAFIADASLTPADYRIDDIIPSVRDYLGRYPAGGPTYGFPFMTNSHVLAYRQDLFERYLKPKGFKKPGKTPEDTWTWDEYLRAARLLTGPDPHAPGGKRWGSSMQARAGAWIVYEWYSWLYGAGGRDINYATMTPALGSKESLEAIRRYAGMVGTVAPPAVLSWGHEEETQALGSGLVAMDATWNVELTGYLIDPATSRRATDFAFALSPVGSSKRPTPDMGGYGLLLSKLSKNQQDAYRFMVWVTSPPVHKKIVLLGGTPFRSAEMSDPEILTKYPIYEIYGTALADSIYRARVPRWPEIEDVISKELTKALTKEASPETAARGMQERVAAILKEP